MHILGVPGWLSWLSSNLAQVMISWFIGLSPASVSVLTAQSLEPASDSVSPCHSLCPSPAHTLSLSFKNKQMLKKNLKKEYIFYIYRSIECLNLRVHWVQCFSFAVPQWCPQKWNALPRRLHRVLGEHSIHEMSIHCESLALSKTRNRLRIWRRRL